MIIGFSKHGSRRGSGDKAIHYLTAETVSVASGPLDYFTGERNRRGLFRDPLPVVVRADPERTRRLIDSLDFKHKYTSGVLSFAPGETITPEMEETIIRDFEKTAFAGLEQGGYDLLVVRHRHAGHHELHFVCPRVELATGKSLNIAPPGKASRELFDTLRSRINLQYGLADPDDPARARSIKLPSSLARLKAREGRSGILGTHDVREAISNDLNARVHLGLIKSRDDELALLRNQGLIIRRSGKDYITVEDPNSGKRVRLRGSLYAESPVAQMPTNREKERTLVALNEKLQRLTEARARYNRERYRAKEVEKELSIDPDKLVLIEPSPEFYPNHDGIRTPSLERVGTFNQRISRARRAHSASLERVGGSARHWRERAAELSRSRERFVGSARRFEQTLPKIVTRLTNRRILEKYGVRSAKSCRQLERDMELEMEMTR